jgi:hypothetical protein
MGLKFGRFIKQERPEPLPCRRLTREEIERCGYQPPLSAAEIADRKQSKRLQPDASTRPAGKKKR